MEMEESPEVAIIQHGSGVMQVVHSVFENASMYFSLGMIIQQTDRHSHILHQSHLPPHKVLSR